MKKVSSVMTLLLVFCIVTACGTTPSNEGTVPPITDVSTDVTVTPQTPQVSVTRNSTVPLESPQVAGIPQSSEPLDTSVTTSKKYNSITDFIPDIDSIEELALYAGAPIPRRDSFAYAAANTQEQAQLIALLNSFDFSEFTEGFPENYNGMFGMHDIRIKTPSDTYYLRLSYDSVSNYSAMIIQYGVKYQSLRNNTTGEWDVYSAPAVEERFICHGDVFSMDALRQVVDSVLTNENDPDYCGTMTQRGSNGTSAYNKRITAFAQKTLDITLEDVGTDAAFVDEDYDITFVVGDTMYLLSSGSGRFYRQFGDEILYAALDDSLFKKLSHSLQFVIGSAPP